MKLIYVGILHLALTSAAGPALALSPLTWQEAKRNCAKAAAAVCPVVDGGLPTEAAWSGVTTLPKHAALADPVTVGPKAAGPGGAAPAMVSQSAILWGTTQFIMSRAETELRTWLVDRIFDTVCETEVGDPVKLKAGSLLPETCKLRDRLHLAGLVSSPALLRTAVERDVQRLPATVLAAAIEAQKGRVTSAIEALKNAPAGATSLPQAILTQERAKLDGLVVAAQLAAVLQDLPASGEERNWYAAIAVPESLKAFGSDDIPMARGLAEGSTLLASLYGEGKWPAASDWGYVLLAFAVNGESQLLPAALNWPATASEGVRTVELRRVGGLKSAWASGEAIRSKIEDLRKVRLTVGAGAKGAAAQKLAAILEQAVVGVEGLATFALKDGLGEKERRVLDPARELWAAVAAGDYAAAAFGLVAIVTESLEEGQAQRLLIRATSLAMEVAGATDSAGVEAALNRYAAPAGSYVGKHRGDSGYVGINAYFGFTFGKELAQQENGSWKDAKWGKLAGIWAPVGLEVGRSTPCGSFGLFAQVVDLGALATWRIGAEEDVLAAPPAVGVRQVLSPGGFLTWGIPGAPFSVSAGAALSPSLREVGGDSGRTRDAWRYGVNFAIDIPVFP